MRLKNSNQRFWLNTSPLFCKTQKKWVRHTSDPFFYTYIVYITRQRGYDRNTRKR